jgi:branched-chain amino acid transport system ATP-binding protein
MMAQQVRLPSTGGAPSDVPVSGARGVSVRFGSSFAVKAVDLLVEPGQFCGLIGPNGAGKTTLFDVISGHRTPTSGRVLLEGTDVTRKPALWRSRHGVRRTFQRQQIFGALSVEDNVLAAMDWRGGVGGFWGGVAGLRLGKDVRDQRRERVAAVLETCGLDHVRGEFAGNLPIGLARMLEVARAIADSPRFLLLDEPTSGLGHADTARLGAVIDQFRRDSGCSVLLVEHDVSFVMTHCERVVVLQLGELLADGEPAAIQADPAVREAYLGAH